MKNNYQHFSNTDCEYYPCHELTEALNCLFCYCPMYFIQCPGKYEVLSDGRKDCMNCTLPHQSGGWEIVQKVMEYPRPFIATSKK